jgi:hypothetical protein
MTARTILGSVAVLALVAGCAEGMVDDEVGVERAAQTTSNGISMNGISMNGISMNGISMNGISMNGISMNGISMNGISMNGISMNGTTLSGWAGSKYLTGTAMVGAILTATTDSGAKVQLRIDDVQTAPDPTPTLCRFGAPCKQFNENADVKLYSVSYCAKWVSSIFTKTKYCASWSPLCPGIDAFGASNKAIPVMGKWASSGTYAGGMVPGTEASYFTFSCRDAAMAKCVERLGYKPWRNVSVPQPNDTDPSDGIDMIQISLAPYHRACVRMIRADYCGNGTPLTKNGTPIDAWDGADVNVRTRLDWGFEAEWDENGAKCVSDTRWGQTFTSGDIGGLFQPNAACPNLATCPNMLTYLQKTCPSKAAEINSKNGVACGTPSNMTPMGFFSQTAASIANGSSTLPGT